MNEKPLGVYAAIANVMADLSKRGIAKNQQNIQQRFRYRGIDDVYNALAGTLSRHGLAMLPTVESREVVELKSRAGGALFLTVLKVRYTLVCADDGSSHDIVVYGEAMDSGDKGTNKAMSAAFKYAAFQIFCIPVEGEIDDPDATSHEVAPSQTDDAEPNEAPKNGNGKRREIENAAYKWTEEHVARLRACQTRDELEQLQVASRQHIGRLFDAYPKLYEQVVQAARQRLAELGVPEDEMPV